MKILAFLLCCFLFIVGLLLLFIFPFSYFVIGFAIGAICGSESSSNTMGCAIGGLLLGPFAIILVPMMIGSKRCPNCIKMIDRRAKVCPNCHSDLSK